MHIAASLEYLINAPGWLGKFITGFVILLIPFVGPIIWNGYALRIDHKISNGNEEILPPWLDVGDYFTKGFAPFLGLVGYFVPAAIRWYPIGSACDLVSFKGLLIMAIGAVLFGL